LTFITTFFRPKQLDQLDAFDEATRLMVVETNALGLFPRLAQKTAGAR